MKESSDKSRKHSAAWRHSILTKIKDNLGVSQMEALKLTPASLFSMETEDAFNAQLK
ncbi:MAG: hypothetical protein GQ581_10785 [Methyloprofundus sp.]|nr:hypothetical protein [Methyloprofundus sp.]